MAACFCIQSEFSIMSVAQAADVLAAHIFNHVTADVVRLHCKCLESY